MQLTSRSVTAKALARTRISVRLGRRWPRSQLTLGRYATPHIGSDTRSFGVFVTFDLRLILCAVLAMTACGDNTSWDSVIAAEAAAGAHTVEVSLGDGASTRVEASVIASIPPTADVSPRPPGARVARGPGGTYIITGTYRTAAYTVHGSAGELLKIVNREGSGPGEYKYPEWAVTRRDSVFVFDNGNARVAVLDSLHTHARYFSRLTSGCSCRAGESL